jgi:hypothetical protein
VLDDANTDAGNDLARAFVASLRRTKPVLDATADPETAYGRILSVTERPLVGSVHWPIIVDDPSATLDGLDAEYAAAVIWREAP